MNFVASRGSAFALVCAMLSGAAIARAQPSEPPAITVPHVLSDTEVPYPQGAKGDATVRLVLTIDPEGVVIEVTPETDIEPFASHAAAAAKAWRYEPATRAGKPIASKIRIEVAFHEPPPPVVDAPKEESAPKPPRVDATQDVTVRGTKPEPSRTASLSRAEVRQIPGTFGDPFRAIEVLPGVTPIVSGLPFFFIRGAPPGNVGYYLDGIRVPLLFHVGIGPSVVHPGLIDRVDLYPGGYPARFGRFSGGIVSGETTAPATEAHGEYNLRLFDAGALAETPFDGTRGSILVGGRYSYTAGLLTQFSPNTVLDYWDYQGRVTYDLTPDDRIGVFAFGSYDYLGEKTPTETLTLFGTEFHRVDARYDHRLSADGTIRVAVTGGLDRSRLQDDRFVRDRLLGARSELTYRLSPRALLRAGADVQMDNYDVGYEASSLSPASARLAAFFPTRSDLAMGTRADVVFTAVPGFDITPGVRLDMFSSQGATAVAIDPRVATRTELTAHMRILSALGISHQPPSFVVPVPGFQPGGLKGGLQKAAQESMGLEFDLGDATTATATAFHNAFYDMSDPLGVQPREPNGCPPGSFPSDSIAGDRGRQPTGTVPCGTIRFPPGTVGPDRSGGGGQGADSTGTRQAANVFETRSQGSAYGLELFLKRKLTRRVGGFLSYTLSRSIRTANNQTYTASFDRTHVANAALAFDLGRSWRAGTRVTFYTGLPKAPDPSDSSTRLPSFFRVDLRIEKRWQLDKHAWISFVAEWMNATLSKEAVSTTCTLAGCESQTVGPITIPSLGIEGGF